MKAVIVVLALLFVSAIAAPAAPLLMAEKNGIPDQYLVVMKDTVAATEAAQFSDRFAAQIFRNYSGVLTGFAAVLDKDDLETIRSSPLVDFVEQDQIVHAWQNDVCNIQSNAIWNLDRVDQREPNLEGNFNWPGTAGEGVDAYIIDTGVMIRHVDFGGRAFWGANFVDAQNDDCNGHGTHVAGTVAGNEWGIAKKATIWAVKVLSCAGSGTITGVVDGVNWVANQYNTRKKPSVANMSLGGGRSTALNNAVGAAVTAGVTFVVAAGNDNSDACNYSPASQPTAITVGSTALSASGTVEEDTRSTFSNYGTCVDIFAPGTLVKSAWIGSTTATRTISGTSMASPLVCGAAAVYLGKNPAATPAAVTAALTAAGTTDVIDLLCTNQVCSRSPNLFVYTAC